MKRVAMITIRVKDMADEETLPPGFVVVNLDLVGTKVGAEVSRLMGQKSNFALLKVEE